MTCAQDKFVFGELTFENNNYSLSCAIVKFSKFRDKLPGDGVKQLEIQTAVRSGFYSWIETFFLKLTYLQ